MKDTLDVTTAFETGIELAQLIEDEFNATQRLIAQPYPHKLKVTRRQFDDLMRTTTNIQDMETGEESEQWRMWVTKDGFVMEVHISEPKFKFEGVDL